MYYLEEWFLENDEVAESPPPPLRGAEWAVVFRVHDGIKEKK